jgi:4-amino-4-deoxy-L-arabinose transferase-like glycosyltransferase
MNPAKPTALRIDAEAVARVVVVVASVWFAFTAVWGLFGIPGAGHIDSGSAANAMAGEQMVKWRIVYPAWAWYTGTPPEKSDYLCTHPYGQEWIPALLIWIFGHKDFVVHLPATLMSSAMPPLLYGIGKARWGAAAGAVAAASFVVVPIAVGFSNFWNLETLTIFGSLLFFWGHSRHLATRKTGYMIASLVGLALACAGDWVGYLIVAPTLVWAFLRGLLLPQRLTPRLRFDSYARWWAASVAIVAGTMLLWVGLFYHADRIGAWLAQGDARAGGEAQTLAQVLQSRKNWIDFSFTPLAISVGKVAAPVCLLLLFVTRRDEETYALGLLFGAVFQYVVFKRGADVHIYWPHYFAPYFALALARVSAAAGSLASWLAQAFSAPGRTGAAVAATFTLAFGLAPTIAMTPDGVRSLWVWRRTGGKYDESMKRSNVDLLFAVKQVVMPKTPRGMRLDAHPSAGWGWEQMWTYQADANPGGLPLAGSTAVSTHPFWIGRGSGLSSDEQRRIASTTHVRVYGDTWIVDQRESAAPLDAFSLNEREPGLFEWIFTNATEPVRSIRQTPDPWLTWEWRTLLGQSAPPPTGDPATLDEIRIAHNAAIERGDAAAADRWRAQIEAKLDRSVQAQYEPGLRLIGIRQTGGVEPRIESWFECMAPQQGDSSFNVTAVVEARSRLSLLPPNASGREMAWPPSMPTGLWRSGQIYKTEVVLNHLIGQERYSGYWAPRSGAHAPHRIGGPVSIPLAVLP